MSENASPAGPPAAADLTAVLKDFSNILDACAAAYTGPVSKQDILAEVKQAKETIFGATLAAFSVPTTSPADTATLAELIAELGAKYPGIETELEGLSGSPAEQREQVMQAVQRRLAADAAKTDALCCLDDSVLSAGSVSPPFDSRMPRKLQHLGDGLAEIRATAATLVSRIAEQEVQTIDTATVAAKFL